MASGVLTSSVPMAHQVMLNTRNLAANRVAKGFEPAATKSRYHPSSKFECAREAERTTEQDTDQEQMLIVEELL